MTGSATDVYWNFAFCMMACMTVALTATVLAVTLFEEVAYLTLLSCCLAGYAAHGFVKAVRRLTRGVRVK